MIIASIRVQRKVNNDDRFSRLQLADADSITYGEHHGVFVQHVLYGISRFMIWILATGTLPTTEKFHWGRAWYQ